MQTITSGIFWRKLNQFIMNVRCAIGLHHWDCFEASEGQMIYRECKNCDAEELCMPELLGDGFKPVHYENVEWERITKS